MDCNKRQIAKFCIKWCLKCNLKNKVHYFQERTEVKKNNEGGHNGGHQHEVVSEIMYFGVKLESTGGWRRQKVRIKASGNQSLISTDKNFKHEGKLVRADV
jgi:hypothetical protein